MSGSRSRERGGGDEGRMDPVEVFCRIRPLPADSEVCILPIDDTTLQLVPSQAYVAAKGAIAKTTENKFTHIFRDYSYQKEVFDRIGLELVSDLIHGKNGLLFAYGITGSGKTYTMTGSPREPGILPRCMDTLFNSIAPFLAGKYVHQPDGYNKFNVITETEAESYRDQDQDENLNPVTPEPKRHRGRPPPTEIDWEMVPRQTEFCKVEEVDQDNAYTVMVSYVEIYNNYIYDLLDTSNAEKTEPPKSKILREDGTGQSYVDKVTEVEVRSTEEAFDCFVKGQRLRRVAHTVLNAESSRSHSVFNIRLVQTPLNPTGTDVLQDKSKVHVSQLSLVDLAGSERSYRTGHLGDRIKETGHINNSLMVLRRCVEQLRENQNCRSTGMVPYRESKLTNLFKNYFDGQGKVRMIVCVNSGADDYEENLHVMQFAEMTQEVEVQRAVEVRYEGAGLTPGRRRAAKFHRQVLAMLGDFEEETPRKRPLGDTLFDPMPPIQIRGPSDDDSLRNLRLHFEQALMARQNYLGEALKKKIEVQNHLRKFVFESEKSRLALEELETEHKIQDESNRKLYGENRQLQHQIRSMTQRLSKFESEARYVGEKEEALRRKERETAVRVQQQGQTLATVRAIFEQGTGIVGTGTPATSAGSSKKGPSSRPGSPIRGGNGGASRARRAASPAPPRYGGSQDNLNRRGISPGRNPVKGTRFDMATGSSTATSSGRTGMFPRIPPSNNPTDSGWIREGRPVNRRVPQPPPKPRNIPHVNAKGNRHRRSKSAGYVIDHQPTHKVPGDTMEPKLKGRKVTKRPESGDLQKASEYALTHQDYDPESGNLRTSLYKGNVLTTAGGGSAVIFEDVERVTHVTPNGSCKRKSDIETDSDSDSKRGRL